MFVLIDKLYLMFLDVLSYGSMRHPPPPGMSDEDLPPVAVQLPMFNEGTVAERAIRSACALDYPINKLFIQVLDDSTDESKEICERTIRELSDKGFRISLRHRTNRLGFKAGALREGLNEVREPFVVIFDADFIPPTDYLRRTIPYLVSYPNVALVQARWSYLNEASSMLCMLQTANLNVHFKMEQHVRYMGHHFFNFNGTAGIWRTEAIHAAGGWEGDSLAEDMDMSLRVWIKGYDFVYLRNLGCLNELPDGFVAWRNQQERWTVGKMQVYRKLMKKVLHSNLSSYEKLHVFLFFMRSYVYWINIGFMLVQPLLRMFSTSRYWMVLLMYCTPSTAWIIDLLYSPSLMWLLPLYMVQETCMSIFKGASVYTGLYDDKPKEFVRTPKAGQGLSGDKKKYKAQKGKVLVGLAELFMSIYLGFTALVAYKQHALVAWMFNASFSAGLFLYASQTLVYNWSRPIKISTSPVDKKELSKTELTISSGNFSVIVLADDEGDEGQKTDKYS
eukprot:CAMPEP_0184675466 /NCGR_PEP_ID=MMETSP0308-20130426/87799_1 /TAXON_ID=38269 /ORGANISM="Gloeochaete witrockiana, Strain SAG 46.84" /LENGTH=503 /DNA_ID=CAMNT_0027123169 /DNA_START=246 /DNA_END=1757 /DNA_ORIENTATION=-